MSPRESRRDRDVREAREAFCRARRREDRLLRWLAWYRLRAVLEDWDDGDELEVEGADYLLVEAARWQRGWRPPTTFHEANTRIRAAIRRGALRGPGGL